MNPEAFHFLRPAWLLALALLVPLAWWSRRRSSDAGAWRAVCDPHLLPHLLVPGRGRAALAPFALFALGWLAACVALAGPTWERVPQPAFEDPSRTVFVLSLAPSMDRDDVPPSRLARARHKLGDAIDRLHHGGTLGLVVFREEAYPAVPLTDDAGVVREVLPRLRTDLAPGRDVLPSRGLAEARKLLDAVGTVGARVLLFTDGSDREPEATVDAARRLARDGATVSVLALTPDDAPDLAAVAEAGGGALARLSADDADLDRLLAPAAGARIGARLARSEVQTDAWRDAGAWLVWIPLALCSLAFRRGWVTVVLTLACVGLSSAPAQAGPADWFQRPDQRGARAFEAGRYAESVESFEDPSWRAAAHYRAGDFGQAAVALRPLEDARSQYNLGNALARSGALEDALDAYEHSLAAVPDDADARFNRDLVQRLLDQQREQEPDAGRSGGGDAGEDAQKDTQGDAQKGDAQKGDAQKGDAQKEGDAAQSKPDGKGAPQQGATGADAAKSADSARSDASDAEAGSDPRVGGAPPPEPKGASPGPAPGSADGSGGAGEPPARGEAAERDSAGNPTGMGATDSGAPTGMGATGSGAPTGMGATGGGALTEATRSSGARAPADPWLAHLPDDPGGLLREKLRRDYLRKREARQRGELP